MAVVAPRDARRLAHLPVAQRTHGRREVAQSLDACRPKKLGVEHVLLSSNLYFMTYV